MLYLLCLACCTINNQKEYQKKTIRSSPKDDCEIEQVQNIYDHYTTEKRFHQMNNPFTTQVNESLNMCLSKVMTKHKHFSSSSSLQYWVTTIITIHNKGYFGFYDTLLLPFTIDYSHVLHAWCKTRYRERERKKVYDGEAVNKASRAHKADAKWK